MRYKSAPAALTKAVGEGGGPDDEGEFEAIVSVFNTTDYDNDVVRPGAFHKSIGVWRDSQDTMPVLWHHRLDDPCFNIGSVLDMAEVTGDDARVPQWASADLKAHGGLWVKAKIDVGDDAPEIARQALRVLRKRRTTQFSYGYDVMPGGAKAGGGGAPNELSDLWVYEISPTQIPSNTHTTLLGAKSDEPPPETGQAGAEPMRWPGVAKARAECDLLVADLEYDEITYGSLLSRLETA